MTQWHPYEALEKARALREILKKAAAYLDDEDAVEAVELFPAWHPNEPYIVDQRVRFEGILYRCLQAHTSQDDWTPTAAVSLWAKVLVPTDDIPVWEQPESTNPYMTGDKVHYPTFSDPVYVSTIDNNVWAPGVYGWVLENS